MLALINAAYASAVEVRTPETPDAEIGEARDHHGAHDLGLDLGAYPGRVRTDQRALEVATLLGRD